ncbi:unnamed protein product [Lota lota]
MSFERVPPRSEVMGWTCHNLADFLRKMNLSGSDKVVLQSSMNGARFVNMTENDVLKFPKLHAPLISKICSEMNKKDERRGLFNKKTTTVKFQEPDTAVENLCWAEDEFESDDDYEDPDLNIEDDEDSGGDYESPTEEQEENDYEPNPSEAPEDFPQVVRPSLPIGEGDYIDNINNHTAARGGPPTLSPRPFTPTHLAPSNQVSSLERRDKSPGRAMGPATPLPPMVERSKKPTREKGDNLSPVQGVKFNGNSMERPSTHSVRTQEMNPKPPGWSKSLVPPSSSALVGRSNSSIKPPPARQMTVCSVHQLGPAPRNHTFPLQTKGLPPRPCIPGHPTRLTDSRSTSSVVRSQQLPPPRPGHSNALQHTQDLDPSWYVGKISRSEADHCLRQEHKDGSYLVRDSTNQKSEQPFTLMVLYQDKVYNIQIRMHNQQYLLGTGIKVHEGFPTVRGMISHYSQTPLLLIDAKNRDTAQQKQCFLSYPAGRPALACRGGAVPLISDILYCS